MKWYSDTRGARTYQIAGDAAAAVVVALGIVLGVALHNAIASLEGFGSSVQRSGTDLSRTMGEIGRQLGGVPIIGGGITAPFRAAGGAAGTLADAGASWGRGIERLATLVGWTTALLVLLVVLLGWVRPRVVAATRRGVLARLVRREPDLELLALRALANRPAGVVARVHPHVVDAWRRGDPEVVRRLAELELKAAGVRIPAVIGR